MEGSNRHILLTGGAGFIGHHFVDFILRNTNDTITVLDRLTYAGNLSRITSLDSYREHGWRVNYVYHDFRSENNSGLITQLYTLPDVTHIVHMGAETHVDNSIADPMVFFQSNVIGTVNMLQLARTIQPALFVLISTDEVYGPAKREGDGLHMHKEGDPHKPGNPYSAAKAGAEDAAMAFYNTYKIPVIITNTMNNFGPRQDVEKYIPKVIQSVLLHDPIHYHVKKNEKREIIDISSRCWIHAMEHAAAIDFIMDRGHPGEKYNIAGQHMNVMEIALRIINHMNLEYGVGYDPESIIPEDFHSFRPGHDMHYGLDNSKLIALGCNFFSDLQYTLNQTVDWYMKNQKWLGFDSPRSGGRLG